MKTDHVKLLRAPGERDLDLSELSDTLEQSGVGETLEWAYRTFSPGVVMATGFGPSGVVLVHHIAQMRDRIPVFYIDTDLLFPSTFDLRDRLTRRFGLSFERVHSGVSVEEQAARHGEALWERDPDKCCNMRKVMPLREFLKGKRAWITGLRRDQSGDRADTKVVEWDARNGLYKVNPLAAWSSVDVWSHILYHDLPYNELHDQGFPSLGCLPCTRSVANGDGERDGRWPGKDKTECGIHQRQEAA